MEVAVLTGGGSAEREVSLESGVQVARALREAGHRVTTVDTASGALTPEEEEALLARGIPREPPDPGRVRGLDVTDAARTVEWPAVAEADVVFVALHGGAGEDGTLQAVLDLADVRYAGSGHLGCALAMDKGVSKRLFRDAGIPTAPWTLVPATDEALRQLGYPLVVKPVSAGSTVGLTVVREPDRLDEAVERAAAYDREVMVERFAPGREFTVGVVADEALPVGEIIPEHEIFDYECKYQPGMAEEVFPAELDADTAARLQEAALRAHRALKLTDYSRVDFILDGDGTPWCLEANALPGMTANSLVPKAAAAAGVPFPQLCDRIVRAARARPGRLGAARGT